MGLQFKMNNGNGGTLAFDPLHGFWNDLACIDIYEAHKKTEKIWNLTNHICKSRLTKLIFVVKEPKMF